MLQGMRFHPLLTPRMSFVCVYSTESAKKRCEVVEGRKSVENAKHFLCSVRSIFLRQKRPRVCYAVPPVRRLNFQINISFRQNLIFNELPLVHRKQFSLSCFTLQYFDGD